jgi:hypothetical protein
MRKVPRHLPHLDAEQVSHIAMESTGIFWRPFYNLLEDEHTIILVNAHFISSDSSGIASHLRGLFLVAFCYRQRKPKSRPRLAIAFKPNLSLMLLNDFFAEK